MTQGSQSKQSRIMASQNSDIPEPRDCWSVLSNFLRLEQKIPHITSCLVFLELKYIHHHFLQFLNIATTKKRKIETYSHWWAAWEGPACHLNFCTLVSMFPKPRTQLPQEHRKKRSLAIHNNGRQIHPKKCYRPAAFRWSVKVIRLSPRQRNLLQDSKKSHRVLPFGRRWGRSCTTRKRQRSARGTFWVKWAGTWAKLIHQLVHSLHLLLQKKKTLGTDQTRVNWVTREKQYLGNYYL